MSVLSRCACALLFLLMAPLLRAQEHAPPTVSLLTFAPGEVYWQRFGHNALLLREPATGATAVFNYGIFDFHQKNFFLNFARGHMLYRLDVEPLAHTLRNYAAEGRWVYEQQLDLDAAQRQQLADFLFRNAQPENAEYRYDYFLANCSTRVRDALDDALAGQLKAQLQGQAAPLSWRQEVVRLMSPAPPLAIGMDLGLGPRVDRPIDAWEDAFIPERLMQALPALKIRGADGVERPLVAREGWLLQQAGGDTPSAAPSWLRPFAIVGLLIAAVILLLPRRPARFALPTVALLVNLVAGLGGLIMLAGWGLTEHWGMWGNRNLLLLNPLSLALLPAWAGAYRAAWMPPRYAVWLAGVIALGAALAPLLALLPQAQPNLQWVALWLPVHLALLIRLAKARR